MLTRVLGYLSGLVMLAACLGGNASAHDILLGVGTHFINFPEAQPALLDLAHHVGVDSVRADTGWRFVERKKGVYEIPPAWDRFVDGARRRHIQPLLILDYGNALYDHGGLPRSSDAIAAFVRFAAFVVKHFAGRVRYYEIWNEWNTGTGGYYPGGSAQDYARLFDATYAAIKKIAPTTVVLAAAGYHDWYAQIAKLGVAERADGVAIHPYVTRELDSRRAAGSNGAERSAQRVIEAERIMQWFSAGKEIPLYITEIGWSTSTAKEGYTEQEAAALAVRSSLMFAALPYVRGVWWYDLIDDGPDGSNPENRFGLFRQDRTLKPVGRAIQSIAPLLKHNTLTWSRASHPGLGIVVLGRGPSADDSIVAWRVRPSPENIDKEGWRYVVSCVAKPTVLRSTPGARDAGRTVQSFPQIFTSHTGHCVRESLPVAGDLRGR